MTEEQLVTLLALEPRLAGRLPSRLAPEDFQRPECRELYRAVTKNGLGTLDGSLQQYYDHLVRRARRQPPQTESQMEAALGDMARRIRERNLKQRVLEAQYLLGEVEPDEKGALIRQVAQLSSQLLRVQLERSRASLYTSPPAT